MLALPVEIHVGVAQFALSRVAPNPASGAVRVEFMVAREGVIDLSVYDIQGRHVATLAHGSMATGSYAFDWPGTGRPGLYLVRYRYPSGQQTRSVLRIH